MIDRAWRRGQAARALRTQSRLRFRSEDTNPHSRGEMRPRLAETSPSLGEDGFRLIRDLLGETELYCRHHLADSWRIKEPVGPPQALTSASGRRHHAISPNADAKLSKAGVRSRNIYRRCERMVDTTPATATSAFAAFLSTLPLYIRELIGKELLIGPNNPVSRHTGVLAHALGAFVQRLGLRFVSSDHLLMAGLSQDHVVPKIVRTLGRQ